MILSKYLQIPSDPRLSRINQVSYSENHTTAAGVPKNAQPKACWTNQHAGDVSCNRPDRFDNNQYQSRNVHLLGANQREKRATGQRNGPFNILSAQAWSLLWFHKLNTALVIFDNHHSWSKTARWKRRKRRRYCWRKGREKRGGVRGEKERDYPAGGNGRQKTKEVEWEDGRTGLFQSDSTA